MKGISELKDIQEDLSKYKKSIESHLFKFNDIYKLLDDTKDYVENIFGRAK